MDEHQKRYEKTNGEATALLKRMAGEKDPVKIDAIDKECAAKIQELRGMIKYSPA